MFEGRVPAVHGAEQAHEVLPDRPRVERVGVLVRRSRWMSPGSKLAVLAEGDEQHAVEDLLRGGRAVRVASRPGLCVAQLLENVLPRRSRYSR